MERRHDHRWDETSGRTNPAVERTIVVEDTCFAGRTGARRAHTHYQHCHSEAERTVKTQVIVSAVTELYDSADVEGCQQSHPCRRQRRHTILGRKDLKICCCLP